MRGFGEYLARDEMRMLDHLAGFEHRRSRMRAAVGTATASSTSEALEPLADEVARQVPMLAARGIAKRASLSARAGPSSGQPWPELRRAAGLERQVSPADRDAHGWAGASRSPRRR
jgi:hypothetical protein